MQQSNGRPLAFLDTNVITAYLRGESPSSELFSDDILKKVRFAINPIVLQELIFLAETRQDPKRLDEIQKELTIIPVNIEKTEEYLKYASNLRNKVSHSNDLLILSNAAECDYFVTYDQKLIKLDQTFQSLSKNKHQVVTPEQFFSQLESKV